MSSMGAVGFFEIIHFTNQSSLICSLPCGSLLESTGKSLKNAKVGEALQAVAKMAQGVANLALALCSHIFMGLSLSIPLGLLGFSTILFSGLHFFSKENKEFADWSEKISLVAKGVNTLGVVTISWLFYGIPTAIATAVISCTIHALPHLVVTRPVREL